jgi:hypothetical protein
MLGVLLDLVRQGGGVGVVGGRRHDPHRTYGTVSYA